MVSGSVFQNVILEKERRGTEAYKKSQIRLNLIDHSFSIDSSQISSTACGETLNISS